MTNLIIQNSYLNEEHSLPATHKEMPRGLPGIDKVEWLIIDEGITDHKVEVAREHGVDHVFQLIRHQGLAKGFMAGIHACVGHGADIMVNTDAKNQYYTGDLMKLVQLILCGLLLIFGLIANFIFVNWKFKIISNIGRIF